MSRSKQTKGQQPNTLRLVGDGEDENKRALSPYGPVNLGLTTSQRIREGQALSESLNSLEKRVETLESRYLEVLDTFISVTNLLVKRGAFTSDTTTTEEKK